MDLPKRLIFASFMLAAGLQLGIASGALAQQAAQPADPADAADAADATDTAAADEKPKEKPAPLPEGIRPYGLTAELLGKLRQGGYLIFFRHGLTPNYIDPEPEQGTDCSTQRNLSKEGIEQTRAIGEAFRELEIPVGIVRASPFCRAMHSAENAFGRFEKDRFLKLSGNEPDRDPPEGKVWKYVRNLAKIPPMPGTNSVFMSHGTVAEIFGMGYLEEGEAVIIKPDGFGGWRGITLVKSDQWIAP